MIQSNIACLSLPTTSPPHFQTLAIAQHLGRSARTHRVSGGIQASHSFTNGGSAVRTEHTRQKNGKNTAKTKKPN
jgi:hypothetical protein